MGVQENVQIAKDGYAAKDDRLSRMSPDTHRLQSYEGWEGVAAGWERWREYIDKSTAAVRKWLVRELAAKPGDTVLELAAGAGDTGFEVAAIIGEHGRLISTDFSPQMIEVARRRGTALGLRNVEYRVMDAEHGDLGAASVDGVLCRFGYMLMADPAAALSETRRVLRPGGRLAFSVWSTPERNPLQSIGVRVLVERGHVPPPKPGTPGPFSMANVDHTRAMLQAAGFTAVRMEDVPLEFAFRDMDEFLKFGTETAGLFAAVLRALPEEERAAVKRQIADGFTSFVTKDGYALPGVASVVVAS
jgi:SAM-dependent methyltransferase